MLKALELVGFKSFADKTRFEFRTGITAVVGPNGSGKSNVVDAIKWVLGEQSVKSLRGKEMADCIFNGSSTRAPLNSAECTLTFDNSHNLLPVETAEVHITRRVYRSGEGEYLINRQPCRLRDIRDLFAGTGAATEAYSVIEQGKVDVLLQSSPKDRRAIFEEAAGISRFKAKKVETLRRLDRVDQNLTRLADIVTEVDNQLRSVRAQATKAQRYREYSGRLQELRTQVASADWRGMTAKLGEIESQLEARRQQAAEAMAEIERLEAAGLELETEAGQFTEDIRRSEARLAENRERIAAAESTIAHSRQLSQELAEEEGRLRRQVAALSARAGDLQHKYVQLQSGVDIAETEHADSRNQLATQQRVLTELTARVDQVRAESEQLRGDYLETMRSAARLGNDIGAFQSQVESAQGRSEQLLTRQTQLEQDKATWKLQYEQLRTEFGTLEQQVQQRDEARAKAASTLSQRRATLAARQKEMATYRQQLSEASGRAAVLEELEQRLEGLRSGVKEVLLEARSAEQGPLTQVRGLVAELFEVATDKAALIEAALGETAQHLVVAPGHELWEAIQQQTYRLPGRVGFIRQKPVVVSTDEDFEHLREEAGVLDRAADLVECEDELRPLVEHLLGRTWVVDNLARGFQLLATTGTGCRFVTTSGELLDSDGTLTAGPRLAAGGIISRRSELRELRQRIITLELQARGVEDEVESLETQIDADESRLRVAEREHRDATQMAADHRLATNAAGQKLTQLDEQLQTLADELGLLDEKLTAAQASIGQATAERTVLEQQIANQESRQTELSGQLEQLDAERQQQLQTVTACQVTLAKSEERLGNLREQLRALEQTKEERGRLIAEAQDQLANNQRRMASSQQAILQAGAAVAELFLTKEQFAAEAVALIQQRTELTGRRNALTGQISAARSRLKAAEHAIHEHDLAAGEIRLQRANLVQQLRDEYDIDLTGLDEQNEAEPTDEREAVDEEIGSLRRKLNNLGSVNLDSLEELDALEARHSSLSGQYNDLVAAKTALERIINRINTDSRRLFAETLETVRGHFQQLFRKLFGGGQADIIVEDDVDLLDSGIEIIARPPGKEPRNISLLSGGEKTMTCVALLLSIFKSRPSPFCVLDEVDAALDEANIERFISVLKEFLSSTQFIVVTHSKKTMTCAGTLYGVTMQESGISKRVSVHFDDVSEDGQLSESARRRAEAAEDDSAAA